MNVAILNVTDRAGNAHALEAVDGWRVMELLRDYGGGWKAPAAVPVIAAPAM